MTTTRFAVVLCAAALAHAGAAAQPAWRCGPDGSIYQQEPCAGGRPVDAADPRSEGDRRAAREAAKADARLADRLERERRSREAVRPAGASGFNARPVPVAAPASAPKAQSYRVPGETTKNKKKAKPAATASPG